ncbi:MAG TPA: hypothetical protein VKG44_03025 [Candidatus Baltobacteraceae bacterium]|nr:hypothetical protein [Candidatus Baltobacteraceae bacterium]
MHKLLMGFALAASTVSLGGISVAAAPGAMPACSVADPPVMMDTKMKTFQVYPAATSDAARQANIAAAQKMMAANPNLKPMCKSAAVHAGGHMANGFGGTNAMHKPTPGPGPTTGQ